MSARDERYAFRARLMVREAAMMMARAGLSAETIRECMADIAETEAEHAIAWGEAEDRRMEAAEAEERESA